MSKLAVTAARSVEDPAVALKPLDYIPDLHFTLV